MIHFQQLYDSVPLLIDDIVDAYSSGLLLGRDFFIYIKKNSWKKVGTLFWDFTKKTQNYF